MLAIVFFRLFFRAPLTGLAPRHSEAALFNRACDPNVFDSNQLRGWTKIAIDAITKISGKMTRQ